MNWQILSWLPWLVAGGLSTAVALYLWQRRIAAGALALMVMASGTALWCLAYALENVVADLAVKVFWIKIQYLGVVVIPPAWVVFSLRFTGLDRLLSGRDIVLVAAPAALTLVLVWTNDLHYLMWSLVRLDRTGLFTMVAFNRGVWFWIFVGYSYLCLAGGTVLLVRSVFGSRRLYRLQLAVVLIGVSLPWLGNVLYVFQLSPVGHLDLTPFALTLTGLAVTWGLFRLRFMDIVPIARAAVVEGMRDAVLVLDRRDRVVDLNDAARPLLAEHPMPVIGRPVADLFHGLASLPGQPDQGGESTVELVLGSGEAARVYDARMSPLSDRRGNPLGRLMVLIDVSERRQVERALAESEARHRMFLERLPDPVVVYDMEGRAIYVNPAFEKTFGWSRDEILSRRMDYVPRQWLDRTRDRLEAMLAGRSVQAFETQRLTKDGRLLDVHLNTAPAFDASGTRIGNIVILRDMTQTKRMEAQLRQSQKMEAIGTLAGGIAHDFNNLLQAISGGLQLIALRGEDDPYKREQLDHIERAAERAAELIRRLMTFSRKVEPELSPVDLNQEIRAAVTILERTIPKMITIDLHLAEDLAWINGDANQLAQILLNLGGNAGDAMPEGGRLTITTASTIVTPGEGGLPVDLGPGRYVELSVCDTGQGMDRETAKNIFDPFFTTKEVGRGTGLGLAIVYGIVENHGGRVWCDTSPGQGTTFRIWLPAVEDENLTAEPDRAPAVELAGGRETILVVDDEPAVLEIARQILQKAGYRVLTGASGEEALAVYGDRSVDVDLVVLDLGMPGMGGHQALRRLLDLDPAAKVIISSGYGSPDLRPKALAAGATGFIAKPYRLTDLLRQVREALDQTGPNRPASPGLA
jgi:PAS domain S-box-containing protein